jgi:hypothetical protein
LRATHAELRAPDGSRKRVGLEAPKHPTTENMKARVKRLDSRENDMKKIK